MDKQIAERMSVFIVGLGAAFTLAVFSFSGPVAGRSTLVGACVALGNWYLLRYLVGRVVAGNMREKALLLFLVIFKMTALLGLSAVLVSAGWVLPIAFLVGLSSLAGGLLFGSFVYIARAAGSER